MSRIFRRIAASSVDALSAISSSEMIDVVILSSRNFEGTRASKRISSEVFVPAERLRQSLSVRTACRTRAISSSSDVESDAPVRLRLSGSITFERPPNDGEPNLPESECAS